MMVTQLGKPWAQHPLWDFRNKGHDTHARSGQAHFLREQSRDHPMGKQADLHLNPDLRWPLGCVATCSSPTLMLHL